MTSSKNFGKDLIQNVGHLESGAKMLLEAIATTKSAIQKSLGEMERYDCDKILTVVSSIEKKLEGVERRLSIIEDKLSIENGAGAHEKPHKRSRSQSKEKESVKAEPAKKAKKERPPEVSGIVFDVVPSDIDVDLEDLQRKIKAIEIDNLTWGQIATEEIGYGISKLRVPCRIVGEVSTDLIVEMMEEAAGETVQSIEMSGFGLTSA